MSVFGSCFLEFVLFSIPLRRPFHRSQHFRWRNHQHWDRSAPAWWCEEDIFFERCSQNSEHLKTIQNTSSKLFQHDSKLSFTPRVATLASENWEGCNCSRGERSELRSAAQLCLSQPSSNNRHLLFPVEPTVIVVQFWVQFCELKGFPKGFMENSSGLAILGAEISLGKRGQPLGFSAQSVMPGTTALLTQLSQETSNTPHPCLEIWGSIYINQWFKSISIVFKSSPIGFFRVDFEALQFLDIRAVFWPN